MRLTTSLLLALFSFIHLSTFGQKEDFEKFLTAYQNLSSPDSKEFIKSHSFNYRPNLTIMDYGNVQGNVEDTDSPGIKVFKGSVVCKIESNSGRATDQKMLAIMYFDKVRNVWAVYGFRPFEDANHEYEQSKAEVDAGRFYTQKEAAYRNLAYWSLMSGRIEQANKYTNLALEAANQNKNESFLVGTDKVIKAIL